MSVRSLFPLFSQRVTVTNKFTFSSTNIEPLTLIFIYLSQKKYKYH